MRKSEIGEVTGRLLVVDDIEMNRDALSRRLTKSGHVVETARNGREALEMIEDYVYDLVLLDIMMPELSGWEVLERVRKKFSPEELPIIMATGRTGSEDVVTAMERGANDYVTKPLDFPIVRARVETQLKFKRASDLLAEANRAMRLSLESAAKVQRAGLPNSVLDVEGFDFGFEFCPCDQLAGDGLNFSVIDSRHAIVCLWDVSGHGVPAALLSVSIAHYLDTASKQSIVFDQSTNGLAAPAVVAARLNQVFPMIRNGEMYFTLCYGVLDLITGDFRYVSAGHEAPIHVLADGSCSLLQCSGTPIGMLDDATPDQYQEEKIQLASGDRLYLFSDGLHEQVNADNQPFGLEALHRCCCDNPIDKWTDHLSSIIASVQDHGQVDGFADDVSLLGLIRK